MKELALFFVATFMCLSLISCSGSSDEKGKRPTPEEYMNSHIVQERAQNACNQRCINTYSAQNGGVVNERILQGSYDCFLDCLR